MINQTCSVQYNKSKKSKKDKKKEKKEKDEKEKKRKREQEDLQASKAAKKACDAASGVLSKLNQPLTSIRAQMAKAEYRGMPPAVCAQAEAIVKALTSAEQQATICVSSGGRQPMLDC